MADFFSQLMSNPQTAYFMAMGQGNDPQAAMAKQVAINTETAKAEADQAAKANMKAFIAKRAANPSAGFGMEDVSSLLSVNPEIAMKLYENIRKEEAARKQQEAISGLFGGGMGGEGDASSAALRAAALLNPDLIPSLIMQDKASKEAAARENRNRQDQLDAEDRKKQAEIEKEVRNPTENVSNSFGFAQRMANAAETLNNPKYTDASTSAWEAARGATNLTASSDYQEAKRAQTDWLTANLRKESGATIPEHEYEVEAKKYLPMVGDSKEVLASKAQARKIAENSMKTAAGSLWAAKGGKAEDVLPPSSAKLPQAAVSLGISLSEWQQLSPAAQKELSNGQ